MRIDKTNEEWRFEVSLFNIRFQELLESQFILKSGKKKGPLSPLWRSKPGIIKQTLNKYIKDKQSPQNQKDKVSPLWASAF